MTITHHIDEGACTGDGVCVSACPVHLLSLVQVHGRTVAAAIPEREANCIGCAHCMALCKAKAITVGDLSYERDLFDLADNPVDLAALTAFLASRRSIRAFRPDAVSRDQLEAIARTIGLAPMGFPPPRVELTIVTERATIERALVPMVELYQELDRRLSNPVARVLIRRRVGRETWASLDGHLRPMLGYRMADTKAGRYDTITRGAPALILLHARAGGASLANDAAIALAYGLLGAHALGLGATALDLVPPAVNRSPAVRRILSIPAEDDVLAAMIVGHPKVRFRRGIRRAPAAVHWVPASNSDSRDGPDAQKHSGGAR